ncbi:MAG: hypothetical protein ABEI78_01190 [Candidatus Nanohaloarchaea archaeon]
MEEPEKQEKFEKWRQGAEYLEKLEELESSYDKYAKTANNLYQHSFPDKQAQKYKQEILQQLADLTTQKDFMDKNIYLEKLDHAFKSAAEYVEADQEYIEEFQAQYPEKHDTLVKNTPINAGVETPTLRKFMPEEGNLHNLTMKTIQEGEKTLEQWINEIENVREEQEPATTSEDREESAKRMVA